MNRTRSILLSSACALVVPAHSRAAATAYRSAVLADGATAYYEFDEASGLTTASDSAGGDNGGTLAGAVSYGQTSAYPALNTAAGFTGAGAVRIPDAAVFDLGTGPFSLEAWFFTNNDGRGDLFTYKGGGGDFGLHSNSQGDPAGFSASNSVYFNAYISDPGAGAQLGQWHHVAVTRNAANLISIYVDGTVRASGTNGGTLNIANDLLIGSNHDGNPSNRLIPFTGTIDEVAWYPVTLSQAQIDNHIALASVPEPSGVVLAVLAGSLLTLRRRR